MQNFHIYELRSQEEYASIVYGDAITPVAALYKPARLIAVDCGICKEGGC